MKQKDIALIVVIGLVSAVFSIVLSKSLFSTTTIKKQKVEVVQAISPSFNEPDKAYFNSTAFDPTRQITIGQNVNSDPFKDTGSR